MLETIQLGLMLVGVFTTFVAFHFAMENKNRLASTLIFMFLTLLAGWLTTNWVRVVAHLLLAPNEVWPSWAWFRHLGPAEPRALELREFGIVIGLLFTAVFVSLAAVTYQSMRHSIPRLIARLRRGYLLQRAAITLLPIRWGYNVSELALMRQFRNWLVRPYGWESLTRFAIHDRESKTFDRVVEVETLPGGQHVVYFESGQKELFRAPTYIRLRRHGRRVRGVMLVEPNTFNDRDRILPLVEPW